MNQGGTGVEAALLSVDKISLLLMVLTLGGQSQLNAFVTEKNAVPLSLPTSFPAPPRLAQLIADPISYPESSGFLVSGTTPGETLG